MILLTGTSDKVQVVTSAAVTVDVHASWVDYTTTSVTPGRTNTAISTAATSDVVGSPAASTYRNLKTLHIRNKHATSSVTVTVQHYDGTTTIQLYQTTLVAGGELAYIEGAGFVETDNSGANGNANTGDVTATSADTYLSGSSLAIANRLRAGSIIRWRFAMTKTAAGTATPIYTVRTGTNGSTADTARLTFTGVAQTAAIDTGWHELELIVQNATSSGVLQGTMTLEHKNTTTGLQNQAQIQILQATSGAFDLTAAGLLIGVSCNPGASGVWTFETVTVSAHNLIA